MGETSEKGMLRVQGDEFRRYMDRYVLQHRDEMVATLLDLLKIPSVGAEETEGAPFGPEVDRALKFVMNTGRSFGLKVEDVDGYAIYSEVGTGPEEVLALTHVDVVPIGSGWTRNPLGEMAGGRVFGRGALDNKGPTVACLYALKALNESGIDLRRRVRHVVGGNEESGFRCIRHYFEVEPPPRYGFSPDACFPVVYAEKAAMNVRVVARLGRDTRAGVEKSRVLCLLEDIHGGEAANIVPGTATAVLRMAPGAGGELGSIFERLKQGISKVAEIVGGPGPARFEFSQESDAIVIRAYGSACHASVPWNGTNAIAMILHLVASLGPVVQDHAAIRFMAQAADIYGRGLDISCEDDITGKLSCNLGVIGTEHAQEGGWIWGIYNIRYPVRVSGDMLKTRALSVKRPEKVEVEVLSLGKPHYTDPKSFLVQTLLRVYREESGDMSPPITIGGGTYAKLIPGGVAYGPVRPGQIETSHQPDESILVGDLLFLVKVYARACLALANE